MAEAEKIEKNIAVLDKDIARADAALKEMKKERTQLINMLRDCFRDEDQERLC